MERNIIQNELNQLGVVCDSITVLQNKDGVAACRIVSGQASYVVKYFYQNEYKREMENYRILTSLGIPTLRVIASTDSALLLEDIDRSPIFRLGLPDDLYDPEIARRIAAWYKQLHSQGYKYIGQRREPMYDESDFFTLENIAYIKEKTGTQAARAWALLEQVYRPICGMLGNARRTLTYNDFYSTNMVVAKDKSAALMFDYNLLGKGYAYADVRNVLSALSEEAGMAFLEEYGAFDPAEKALDDVVSVIVTLYLACRREALPGWAQGLLDGLDTTFIQKIEILRRYL